MDNQPTSPNKTALVVIILIVVAVIIGLTWWLVTNMTEPTPISNDNINTNINTNTNTNHSTNTPFKLSSNITGCAETETGTGTRTADDPKIESEPGLEVIGNSIIYSYTREHQCCRKIGRAHV